MSAPAKTGEGKAVAALEGRGPLAPDLAIPVAEREECVLRPLRAEHRDGIARNLNHRSVWRNITNRVAHPYSLELADEWIAINGSAQPPGANFAIECEGEAIGCAGARRNEDLYRPSAEIGYWIGPDYWGRGIATAVLRTLTRWFFDHSDLERLEAGVLEWNPASCRVLEKANYQREARKRRAIEKDGEIIDAFLYAIVRADLA